MIHVTAGSNSVHFFKITVMGIDSVIDLIIIKIKFMFSAKFCYYFAPVFWPFSFPYQFHTLLSPLHHLQPPFHSILNPSYNRQAEKNQILRMRCASLMWRHWGDAKRRSVKDVTWQSSFRGTTFSQELSLGGLFYSFSLCAFNQRLKTGAWQHHNSYCKN